MAGGAGQDRADGEDRARPGGAVERRGGGRGLTARARTALVATACLLAACTRRPRPAPEPPAPPPRIVEQRLPPTTSIELQLSPPRETRSADGREVFVEGTVHNRGSKPTRDVRVTVRGLDAQGNELARGDALPTPQLIPPGGRATYVVRLPDDPAIRTYKAEAIGR